jgi:ATP phosphoribosyltransferase
MSEMLFAIPSKGRLKDECLALLARAGLAVTPPAERAYETAIPALPGLKIVLVSASEIAERMVRGEFHAGITGEDVLREALGALDGADRHDDVQAIGGNGPVRAARLGFGPARLVTAVPMGWIDCVTMEDVRDIAGEIRLRQKRPLRVATKYVRLTRAFFARHLVTDYRIAFSTGATEAAPASGLADVIVDITTSGATLQGNALKILDDGEIFASEACLFLGPRASGLWQDPAPAIAALVRALTAAAGRAVNAEPALALIRAP